MASYTILILESFLHGDLQYAELEIDSPNHQRLKQNKNGTGISSILIYQADHVLIEAESPEYTRFLPYLRPQITTYFRFEFISDIGGTAGLVLGVSAASLIGFIEKILKSAFKQIMYKNLKF